MLMGFVLFKSGMNSRFWKIYDNMKNPIFIFDGLNIVHVEQLGKIGFIVYSIGKPLDRWARDLPTSLVGSLRADGEADERFYE